MPSPSQAVRVGTPISWCETDSPPMLTVSNPTGPERNSPEYRASGDVQIRKVKGDSPSPYVMLKLTLGNGWNVFDAAVSKPGVPKAQVSADTGFPSRSKQLKPFCATQVSELDECECQQTRCCEDS